MQSPLTNPLALRICVWCGPAVIVVLTLGLVVLGGFIPPPSPQDSAQEVTSAYLDDLDAIRAGLLVSIFGMCLIAPWGVSIAVLSRRMEGSAPIWTYLQVVSVAIGVTIAVLCAMVWAIAAYRPDDTSPDITRLMNDFGWYLFLFSAPAFSVWMVAIAGSIFSDKSERPVFPRWVAYMNLYIALGEIPAIFLLVAKDGPLAFNGVLCFWLPTVVFFTWMAVMSVVVIRAIKQGEQPAPETAPAVAKPAEPAAPVAAG